MCHFSSILPLFGCCFAIKDLFRRSVGNVEYVELFSDENGKPRGAGIVEFKDPEHVGKALEVMNRYELNGRELVVKQDYGEERDKYGRITRGSGGGGGGGGMGGMGGSGGGGGGGGGNNGGGGGGGGGGPLNDSMRRDSGRRNPGRDRDDDRYLLVAFPPHFTYFLILVHKHSIQSLPSLMIYSHR